MKRAELLAIMNGVTEAEKNKRGITVTEGVKSGMQHLLFRTKSMEKTVHYIKKKQSIIDDTMSDNLKSIGDMRRQVRDIHHSLQGLEFKTNGLLVKQKAVVELEPLPSVEPLPPIIKKAVVEIPKEESKEQPEPASKPVEVTPKKVSFVRRKPKLDPEADALSFDDLISTIAAEKPAVPATEVKEHPSASDIVTSMAEKPAVPATEDEEHPSTSDIVTSMKNRFETKSEVTEGAPVTESESTEISPPVTESTSEEAESESAEVTLPEIDAVEPMPEQVESDNAEISPRAVDAVEPAPEKSESESVEISSEQSECIDEPPVTEDVEETVRPKSPSPMDIADSPLVTSDVDNALEQTDSLEAILNGDEEFELLEEEAFDEEDEELANLVDEDEEIALIEEELERLEAAERTKEELAKLEEDS